ncbi:MAG: ROK family protein [Phycisphaeraceae bacterium]
MAYAIGIDIGGTQVKAVRVAPSGQVFERSHLDAGDAQNAWQPAIRQWVQRCQEQHGPCERIGVSCPGIARPDGSGIAWMVGRMEGVMNFDFQKHLGRSDMVPVLNDALAALLGEVWQGAARGASDVVLLTLGTGVGGAVYSGGRLLKGHSGRAGHLGHITVDAAGPADICNTPGSIEYHIGNYSLAQRSGGRFTSTQALVQAYLAGDATARELWLGSIHRLAAAIVSIINAVDPQRIILGGGIALSGQALFGPLQEAMDRMEWRPTGDHVKVLPAALGQWAGAIGAAWNGLRGGQA